jgi:hypothetical protein
MRLGDARSLRLQQETATARARLGSEGNIFVLRTFIRLGTYRLS